MTGYQLWELFMTTGECTREQIDAYFLWVATSTEVDQLALELTTEDGVEYTNKNNETVKVTD
jgi:hypothetical protein